MGTFIEPFNFKTILLDFFLGNSILLVGALFIILSALCGYYQMSNRVYAIIMIISFLLFTAFVGEAVIMAIVIVVGLIVFKILGEISNR